MVHLTGQELPSAHSGLLEAGMGLIHTARQQAARSSKPSAVQMEAGDMGSGHAVSDPAQANRGLIPHSLGAEPTRS